MKNREIKFRAWDKENKVMSIIRSWDFAHGDIELGKDLQPDADKFEKDLEIMQFTGLYDKNGKEIYEGDILTNNKNDFFDFVRVDYIEYLARFVASNEYDYTESFVNYKVIGNIYENPELLKSL